MSYSAAIVHLSDIECGVKNRAANENIVDAYTKCADRLITDLRSQLFVARCIEPQRVGLIVTGDCADTGGSDPEEYEHAARLLEYVRDRLGISRDLLAVIPGNHDVDWGACQKAFNSRYSKEERTVPLRHKIARELPEKHQRFDVFLQRICELAFPRPETVLAFPAFARLGFAVVGLDSTYPCTFCDDDNYGNLRDDQVNRAGEELRRIVAGNPSAVPLALLHHCPIPTHDDVEDKSFLRNATDAIEWLGNNGFRAVLCGHEHQSRVTADCRRSYHVFTSGSFGVNTRELINRYRRAPRIESNKYQILLVNSNGYHELLFRKLGQPGSVDGDWLPDADDGPESQIFHLRSYDPATGAKPLSRRLHPIISYPVRLAGQQSHVLAMAIAGPEDVLSRVKRVIYCFGDKHFSGEERDEQFAVHAELDLTNLRSVEVRVSSGDGPPVSLGEFSLPPAQELVW